MKMTIRILLLIIGSAMFTASSAYAQDTSENQKLTEEHTYPIELKPHVTPTKPEIYRDTRLGGSSPYFNTYEKNDYGAGAITTDPNKANGIARYPQGYFDSSNLSGKIYRDTRLGGSSPGHRTYKTNDYGAGAITTDPNKGNTGDSPVILYPTPDTTGK